VLKNTLQNLRRRLEKHDDDLRSLSIMSQVIRSNLTVGALLNMVYLQVDNLVTVDHFVVALIDREQKLIEYPLCIRSGTQIDLPPEPLLEPNHLPGTPRPLLYHVLKTGSAVLVEHDAAREAAKLGYTLPEDIVSWIGAPLQAMGQVIGVMIVASNQLTQRYTGNDLRLINIVAASAGVALENAQLYEQQEARVRQLAALNQISTKLTGSLSPAAVLDTVVNSVQELSPQVKASSVYLFWDDQKTTLALVRSSGWSERYLSDPPMPALLYKSREQDFSTLPPLLVPDRRTWLDTIHINGAHDESAVHLKHLDQVMANENVGAWIELPISVGNMAMGVLALYFDTPMRLPPEHVEVLRAFATQIAQSLGNARLYEITDEALERRVGQLLALAAIGHELTATIDLDEIGNLVLNHAMDATGSQYGAVALFSPTNPNQIERIAVRGYARDKFAQPADVLNGIGQEVIATRKPLIVGGAFATHSPHQLASTAKSALGVPIVRGNSLVGVLLLENERANAFNEEDIHFTFQLANQAVIAVDNARLFRRIAEARDRMEVILNAMQEALVLIDQHGVVRLANPRVAMLGISPLTLIDQPVEELLEKPELHLLEKFGFSDGETLRQIVDNLRGGSSHWVEQDPFSYTLDTADAVATEKRIQRQIIPVQGADSTDLIGVLMVFYDESEQYKLAQTREDLSRMLIHDLRSPLTAVTTSLKLMTEIVPKTTTYYPAVESTTDAARRAIRKLLTRVDSLLDVSRMENGFINIEAKPTEIATLVDNVCVELSPLARELNIQLVTDGMEQIPPLMIDPDKVERVLLNLVDNALKFSPMDSRVIVRAGTPGQHGAPEGFVRIDVIDQGPGVPDEYKVKLFDRYVQVQGRVGSRRGSGLGLTFCRLVAEAHGGRIWIEDNETGGSIFVFTLPVAPLIVSP